VGSSDATENTKEPQMKHRITTALVALAFAAGLTAGQQPAAAPQGQAAAPAAPEEQAKPVRSAKSPEESKAVQAVLQALTPDDRIKAADSFVETFPKSELRAAVLAAAAQSYQQKNDFEKVIVYGEQALNADPDDATKVQMDVLLAKVLAQRTREFDLDRDEKLAKAEKYANSALAVLKTIAKPNPALSDEQWDAVKTDWAADAHDALGMDQLARKNYEQAIAEFKIAVETAKDVDPATQTRLAAAYGKAGKYDEAIATCDKVLATPDLHPAIRRFVEAERARDLKAKNAAAGPATPAAPAAPAAPAKPAEPVAPAPAPKP
jgi:tetratricopeptide (TPR) repeat protein